MFSALQLVFLAVTIINIMGTERQAKVKITEEYKFHQKYERFIKKISHNSHKILEKITLNQNIPDYLRQNQGL